ncbi:MAG: zf-HC2 domain-containing protein [Candidatus Aminicenantes bacterium]|nr:zf-HC2 domain-containing protein [Candidatus Aminicenantes bacterium]
MKCRKVCSWLPLLIEGDMDRKKKAVLEKHLNKCPSCREEYNMMRSVLKTVVEGLREGRPEWTDTDWQLAVRKTASSGSQEKSRFIFNPFRRARALAVTAALAAVLVFSLLFPLFKQAPGNPSSEKSKVEQDMVSMTMVSKESGLQIVWIFNKNFTLEDNK